MPHSPRRHSSRSARSASRFDREALAQHAKHWAADAETLTIIGTVLAVGFGLAGLMIRTTARLDRRIDNDKVAADADRRAFQDAMSAFRAEMQRLAERQSHVEGRIGERGAAAD